MMKNKANTEIFEAGGFHDKKWLVSISVKINVYFELSLERRIEENT